MLLVSLLMPSCTPTPDPIAYGSDMCHYCKMTIVDRQYGCEVVTKKGKVFKFDAIECMIPYIHENADTEYAFILVSDYEVPASLVDAQSSHFLVSPAIQSPMGGNLSAFSRKESAIETAETKGGDIFNWSQIALKYK